MATYREHQRLVRITRELAELLDCQSRQITRTARQGRAGDDLPDDSALRGTWRHLGMAFQLLTAHAQSIRSELARLGLEFEGSGAGPGAGSSADRG